MAATRILLVQLYSNGDCLYATAVARQIKQDFPGCHLTWAVAGFCKNIIAHNPDVDELMEVTSVPKDNAAAFRKFTKAIAARKAAGEWQEVFITHILGNNLAWYDGCIRSNVLRGYQRPITVSLQPTLRLYPEEVDAAAQFAIEHRLAGYTQVVLFEFAPQSGQSRITKTFALEVAGALTQVPGTAVILSSALKIEKPGPGIIDGSRLSFRETAALTHYCTLLLGASSGITWISTSTAAKQLPMVQLLNPDALWPNPISRDFERFNIPGEVIELIDFDQQRVVNCVTQALFNFSLAKTNWNQPIPLHFKTTHRIIYNLLCYGQFKAIANHIRVNREVYGNNRAFYRAVLMGFLRFPWRLIRNLVTK